MKTQLLKKKTTFCIIELSCFAKQQYEYHQPPQHSNNDSRHVMTQYFHVLTQHLDEVPQEEG